MELEAVTVQEARVRVDGIPAGALEAAQAVSGVSFVTVIAVGEVAVGEPGGGRTPARVAMVDPAGFRVLTPQVTADALDMWDRLASGEAVFTHEHAQRLRLQLGTFVPLGDDVAVRVGAFATHATPPVADAIVDVHTGRRLGLGGAPRSLLASVTPGAAPETVAGALEQTLGAPAHVIADPRAPQQVVPGPAPGGDSVWDRLALCESSGRWHINTGNGYYGGLQFLPESWYLVGGAGMPHEASREEQIYRAERLLAIQGWKAWPVCSILLGLRPGPLPERYRHLAPDPPAEPEPPPGPAHDQPPPQPPPEELAPAPAGQPDDGGAAPVPP